MLTRVAALVLTIATAGTVSAQPLPAAPPSDQGFSPERLGRLHAMLDRQVQDGVLSGAISLIARRGRVVDVHVIGQRDRDAGTPMTRDTIVRMYSMTKIVTSVAVMMLVEEGKLKLTDQVGTYWPELAKMSVWQGGTAAKPELAPAKQPITIKHLLTHTSGLVYGFGNDELSKVYQQAKLYENASIPAFVSAVAKMPLAFEPGERYAYGFNTDVLGAVVEKVSGIPFERFVVERIATPLGMVDTSFDVPESKRGRLARIDRLEKDRKLARLPETELAGVYAEPGRGFAAGGAGLFSTADDFARFGQMLLNGGELGGVRLLGRKTVELMMQNHLDHLPRKTIDSNESDGFGLGGSVRIDLARGNRLGSVGQFGWAGAATTYINLDPREETLVILVAQRFPFNADDLLGLFSTLFYQSLVK
jgi:CubicO group peptidase (beta-lactamase class C family)